MCARWLRAVRRATSAQRAPRPAHRLPPAHPVLARPGAGPIFEPRQRTHLEGSPRWGIGSRAPEPPLPTVHSQSRSGQLTGRGGGHDALPGALTQGGLRHRRQSVDSHCNGTWGPRAPRRRHARCRREHPRRRGRRRLHRWVRRAQAHPEAGDVGHRLGVGDHRKLHCGAPSCPRHRGDDEGGRSSAEAADDRCPVDDEPWSGHATHCPALCSWSSSVEVMPMGWTRCWSRPMSSPGQRPGLRTASVVMACRTGST